MLNCKHELVRPFVSIVVTVYNAQRTIRRCLHSIMDLEYPEDKLEVIVVDDGSTDKSVEIVKGYPVKLIQKARGGYPSAMNTGINMARGDIVVIIDSDIYVTKDWLAKTIEEFNDRKVGIVGGFVAAAKTRHFWAKLAGFDIEDRYRRVKTKYVDHLSSTCTAYRKEMFSQIGAFDEKLKRDSDEDLAHRAFKSGWKIVLRKDALCFHEWKGSFRSYFIQQVREGKYAVAIVRKAPDLLFGKEVQPSSLYIPLTLTVLLLLTPIFFWISSLWIPLLAFIGLIVYHLPATIRIIEAHGDLSMLLFPLAINLRYIAWIVGFAVGIINEVM